MERGGAPRYQLVELEEIELYHLEWGGRMVWVRGEEAELEPESPRGGRARSGEGVPVLTFGELQRSLTTACGRHPGAALVLCLDAESGARASVVLEAHAHLQGAPWVDDVQFVGGAIPLRRDNLRASARYRADGRFAYPDGTPIAPVSVRSDGTFVVDLPPGAAKRMATARSGPDRLSRALGYHARPTRKKNGISRAVMVLRLRPEATWKELHRAMAECCGAWMERMVVRIER